MLKVEQDLVGSQLNSDSQRRLIETQDDGKIKCLLISAFIFSKVVVLEVLDNPDTIG